MNHPKPFLGYIGRLQMELGGITGLDRTKRSGTAVASGKGEVRAGRTPAPRSDSFVASIQKPTETNSRALLLEAVRARIKSGFYNGDEVTDDVSDKLAQLFDR